MNLPRVFTVKQSLASHSIEDVGSTLHKQLAAEPLLGKIRPGDRVAIALGSRGINRIDQVARSAVDHLTSIGASPLIVPAMGSHGGATAEGQRDTLAALGITPSSVGCPIESSMETVALGSCVPALRLYFDTVAGSAELLTVLNRLTPLTRLV